MALASCRRLCTSCARCARAVKLTLLFPPFKISHRSVVRDSRRRSASCRERLVSANSMIPAILQQKRHQQILTDVVRHYIETGEPVSSRSISRRHIGAAEPGHGSQRDGRPGRGRISFSAAHLRRACADGGSLPIFCGAGCGAGDRQPGRPAVDPARTGIRANARSRDGAGEPCACRRVARAGHFYFAAASAQRGGACSISAAAR